MSTGMWITLTLFGIIVSAMIRKALPKVAHAVLDDVVVVDKDHVTGRAKGYLVHLEHISSQLVRLRVVGNSQPPPYPKRVPSQLTLLDRRTLRLGRSKSRIETGDAEFDASVALEGDPCEALAIMNEHARVCGQVVVNRYSGAMGNAVVEIYMTRLSAAQVRERLDAATRLLEAVSIEEGADVEDLLVKAIPRKDEPRVQARKFQVLAERNPDRAIELANSLLDHPELGAIASEALAKVRGSKGALSLSSAEGALSHPDTEGHSSNPG